VAIASPELPWRGLIRPFLLTLRQYKTGAATQQLDSHRLDKQPVEFPTPKKYSATFGSPDAGFSQNVTGYKILL
jgi:hypothetical protein